MKRHHWLPSEDLLLAAAWEEGLTAAEIGPLVRHTRTAVHQRARTLGLPRRTPNVPPGQVARVRALHARGYPDARMARRLGCTRGRVRHIRETYLRKPAHPDLGAKRRAVRTQLRTLGLTSPTQLRTLAFQRFARESGWPEDCRPREVQILNALAAAGVPMTRLAIAAAIGVKADPARFAWGQRSVLKGNGPGGSYLATLARRGLVAILWRLGPRCKETGKGNGRRVNLYTLGPAALAILQERASCGRAAS